MNPKAAIPSIFTLANLMLGVLSLISTMEHDFYNAAIWILFAMVLDAMDGKVARKLDVSSLFGKELDSLSDLVSFGVAPALLVYQAQMKEPYAIWGLAVAIIFVLCGAIRLARFNVLNITTYFMGIPITAAGPLMVILTLFSHRLPQLIFPSMMLGLAAFMVSNIKVPKL
ncbi:CDP-diacylglycerol--serine O-phosphatidyltransferase [Heliophilum fasciatum]|uniref:CDP-diacylglycerol--serine O-phosphatidyltransferase n=1 Tax=Heliophilum fasciatum TaxID=35700 RepID=A0A4V6NRL5_9FIRM|nr:CDP-diacylglycerol--serine O-phosphatidyltransferase [Heliophilum fasciatum]MCW2278933.1 CDP-diacylglycerol--serine O-phosphatidyltransferase [Heliophilum fasciatum]TCP62066.1 CDP-diacylglycerol--serine O-phosphatidyltransferase [Heliophilum fasciatum]